MYSAAGEPVRVTEDLYATLGLTPGAKQADIRAAYLQLMRLHHPDRNKGSAAAERAQAIIAAFAVLGDFDRRQEYDWARRREREAAEAALAAPPPRKFPAAPAAAATIGLAAAGALLFMPSPTPMQSPKPVGAPAVERRDRPAAPVVAEDMTGLGMAATSNEEPIEQPIVPVEAPTEDALDARVDPPIAEPKMAEPRVVVTQSPPVRAAAERAQPVAVKGRQVKATARSSAPRSTPGTSYDLASLDRFVMNYYGQTWRYGDAPKRAKLEQSRVAFLSRHAACAAEACKRAAYMRLMREVSDIAEGG